MWIQLFEHKCFILPSSPQKIHQWPTAAWKCSPSLVISEVQIKITLSYIISHLLKWRGCYQKYIACVCCFISESCLILYDPMDCSPRGSSVCGDSPGKNTRVGCHASPRGCCQSWDQTRSPAMQADSLPSEQPGKPKNIGVGSLSFLQLIVPTQELNWGLLHYRWICYQLSYQGSWYIYLQILAMVWRNW